jgi:hypothetical protein
MERGLNYDLVYADPAYAALYPVVVQVAFYAAPVEKCRELVGRDPYFPSPAVRYDEGLGRRLILVPRAERATGIVGGKPARSAAFPG